MRFCGGCALYDDDDDDDDGDVEGTGNEGLHCVAMSLGAVC